MTSQSRNPKGTAVPSVPVRVHLTIPPRDDVNQRSDSAGEDDHKDPDESRIVAEARIPHGVDDRPYPKSEQRQADQREDADKTKRSGAFGRASAVLLREKCNTRIRHAE